jgi:hypothetical protein
MAYSLLVTCGRSWFSPGTSVSSPNKTDCHDITELSTTLVVIGTDCTDSCKSNYLTIKTTTKIVSLF